MNINKQEVLIADLKEVLEEHNEGFSYTETSEEFGEVLINPSSLEQNDLGEYLGGDYDW